MRINYYIKGLKYTSILTIGYYNFIKVEFLKTSFKPDLTGKYILEREDFDNILREFVDNIKNKKEIKYFRLSHNVVLLESVFDSKYLEIDYSKDDRLELNLYSGNYCSYFDSYYEYHESSTKEFIEILNEWIC